MEYCNVSSRGLFLANAPLVINRAGKTHFICRNLYKTYETVGFVPGSNFFLTFCTTQDENQSVDYSQAKGTLIAFYLEPITTRLLDLIDDEEFNQDAFLTYHLSMPNLQSSPSSKLIQQDTLLASNISEVRMNIRSRVFQRFNVGSSKKSIP